MNYSDPTDDLARRIKHQQVGAAAGRLEQDEFGNAVSLAQNRTDVGIPQEMTAGASEEKPALQLQGFQACLSP